MYLWNKAVELAVNLYQINHADQLLADELKSEMVKEEFGHLLSATKNLMTIRETYNLDLYPELRDAKNEELNNYHIN